MTRWLDEWGAAIIVAVSGAAVVVAFGLWLGAVGVAGMGFLYGWGVLVGVYSERRARRAKETADAT